MSKIEFIRELNDLAIKYWINGLENGTFESNLSSIIDNYCSELISIDDAKRYAVFCVMCDRDKMPLIKLEDYLKNFYK